MYAGRVAEVGPVREVVKNPLHPYAKGLMGAIPSLEGVEERLVQIPGSMPAPVLDPDGLRLQSALRTGVRHLPVDPPRDHPPQGA